MAADAEGDIPAELITLKYPLPNLAAALLRKDPVRIVAMGSSSTAGRNEGDVVPYPSRLELYLRRKYTNPHIDVVNRGVGGQEANEELLRFKEDIFEEKPSLVIWQVGTNAVFLDYNLDGVAAKIAEGLERLRQYPIDVVMMDPQYVTAMLLDAKADASDRIVSIISAAAEKAGVSVFRRWALMRHWHVQNGISFERMLEPADQAKLHQSDWSTQRVATALCEAISKAPPAA
jgi:GDSL-like lipase/acylhydrolase family protein